MRIVIDPVFSSLWRANAFYSNEEGTKYSMTQINDSYYYFSDKIAMNYLGYTIGTDYLIHNKSDVTI
jgi:hypothetical protein